MKKTRKGTRLLPETGFLSFAKYHGLGNDFILVNGLTQPAPAMTGPIAKGWCDRRFGVGADGVILVLPSRQAECRMQIFNSDGSEAQMCGNGLRCLVMFARDEGIIFADEYTVETLDGLLPVRLELDAAGCAAGVAVHMGQPRLATLAPGDQPAIEAPLEVNGKTWIVTAMHMGNSQCVVFVPDVDSIDRGTLGPAFECHPAFPQRTNVMFTQVLGPDYLRVVPWERGAGATLACGTGACAAVVAGALSHRTGRQARVALPGGTLHVRWEEPSDQVIMAGPATRVFTGHIEWPDDDDRQSKH